MQRYSAYDPPEYVSWTPDPGLVESCLAAIHSDPARAKVIADLSARQLLDLYQGMVRFRLHDIALKRWVRQGVISKAWLGTGEEAVTIGAVHAVRRHPGGDVVGPMIRNAGACHEMGMSVADMLRGYLGTGDAPSGGRDLHFGDPELGIVAPVSVVGGLCGVMAGYALGFKRQGADRVALTWIGDGSTKSGEVHEALNFAAVMRLPIVFVLQNNQVALGTRLEQHHRARGFSGWAKGYGIDCLEVDGNNVLDVYSAAVLAVKACREGRGPVAIAAETFRMGGHATHDEREARATFPEEQFQQWGRRDPIGLYEECLFHLPGHQTADLTRARLAELEREVVAEVEEAQRQALESRASSVAIPADEETRCYG
ncbi:MAG: thiamine pyrophosphate-dependent dehydrogenase E1 component subunit alpha [Gemmatimonadales bacterium]|nr:MAG: thiamine pyrophosphate-dependent dehydrogenase E1 component subunit alpha [Gemmatimonadales bacterium]